MSLPRLLLPLLMATAGLPVRAGTVSYSLSATVDPVVSCSGSANASPVAIISVTPACAAIDGPITLTSSELGWTASVSETVSRMGGGDFNGTISGSASFAPVVTITGGVGGGFLRVEYLDTIVLPNSPGGVAGSGGIVNAGDLHLSLNCYYGNNFCMGSPVVSDRFWSAWIPFTFDDPVRLPLLSASFNFGFSEGTGGGLSAGQTVIGFEYADAGVASINSLTSQVPEPSLWLSCGTALVLLAGLHCTRPRV